MLQLVLLCVQLHLGFETQVNLLIGFAVQQFVVTLIEKLVDALGLVKNSLFFHLDLLGSIEEDPVLLIVVLVP